MSNIKTEMKKILQRRINHCKILPTRWWENTIKYHDLLGNYYEVPSVGVDLENGGYEELVAYVDELVLTNENGKVGAWNIESGEICWG